MGRRFAFFFLKNPSPSFRLDRGQGPGLRGGRLFRADPQVSALRAGVPERSAVGKGGEPARKLGFLPAPSGEIRHQRRPDRDYRGQGDDRPAPP